MSSWIIAGAEVAAVAIAAAAILASVQGLKNHLWLLTFAEYTRRYSDIMEALPFEARRPGGNFVLENLPTNEQQVVLGAIRNYLNLCSEELYLHRRNKVDDETWRIWNSAMREVVQLPSLRHGWAVMRVEYLYFPEFCSFMDSLVAAGQGPARSTGGDAAIQEPAIEARAA